MVRNAVLAAALLLSATAWAQSAADVQVRTLGARLVTVAANKPSRIAVEGARLSSVVYDEAELSVTADKDNGQVFVRPLVERPISLFLVTDGGTIAILLEPKDVAGQNIVLSAETPNSAGRVRARPLDAMWMTRWGAERAGTRRETSIKQLVLALARGEGGQDISYRRREQRMQLWAETEFVRLGVAEHGTLRGERFLLRNVSPRPLLLQESEFYKPGVVAIAIDRHEVGPGETTEVYVVSEAGHGQQR